MAGNTITIGPALKHDLAIIGPMSQPAGVPTGPGLVVLHGLPGSGKSYFGELVAGLTDAVTLGSDRFRKAIVSGVPQYDGVENKRLFTAMNLRTEQLLEQGWVVIFDSSALRAWIRQPLESIAGKYGIEPVRVHLDPPEAVILERLALRTEPPDPTENVKVWRDVYEMMKRGWQPITEHHLHLTDPRDAENLAETVRQMLNAP